MKQKIFTLSLNPAKSWYGYLSKLVALVLLVSGLGATQQAWGQTYNYDDIYITAKPTGTSNSVSTVYNGTYSINDNIATADFQGADLGGGTRFDQSNGSLILTAVTANINSSKTVKSSEFYYRVYLSGTPVNSIPNYSLVSMSQTSASNPGSEILYSNTGANIDLLNQASVLGGGTYIVEIKFVGAYASPSRNDPNATTGFTDPANANGTGFQATFTVIAPATTPTGGTTIWQGVARGANGTTLTSDQDWANAANWSNGVPTATSNAIIPAKTAASSTTQALVYPFLNDPTYNYAVNNLTLQGNSGSTAAQIILNVATLTIYGNLTQPGGGLVGNVTNATGVANPSQNSTIIFAGGNQIITGQLLVSDVVIAGSGIKSVINTIIPSNIILFRPTSVTDGVVVQSAAFDSSSGTVSTSYVFDTTGNSFISLTANSTISLVPGEAETNVSYIKGVTRVDRTLTATASSGPYNAFGNIGLELRANHTPGTIFVYRVVGDPLSGPVSSTAVPVKRYFKITGDDESTSASTANSTIDIIFHYLNSSDELNGIQESNLALFRSRVNGYPYAALGGTLNTANKTVTKLSVPSISTSYITLGDKTNPLPVSLVAFAAVRSNANALLTWKTASELNNKGFNVQVSADGVSYRTLTFVASKLVNSSNELSYNYTDAENGKAGTRYYRLEQVDLDGTRSYSPVRAVNFDGAAATSLALVAYPNPFSSTLGLNVEGATASTTEGTAYVKLVDMTGRTVRDQKVSLAGASLSLGDLSELRSGLYLAKVTLPDGTVQVVRVQKQ